MRRTPSLGWTPCGWSRAQTTVPRRIEKKYLGGTEATRGRGGGGDEATRRIGDEATRRRGDEARELIACFPAPRLVCGGRQTKARRAAGGSTGVAKRRGARSARRDAPGHQLYLGGGQTAKRRGARSARTRRTRCGPAAARGRASTASAAGGCAPRSTAAAGSSRPRASGRTRGGSAAARRA